MSLSPSDDVIDECEALTIDKQHWFVCGVDGVVHRHVALSRGDSLPELPEAHADAFGRLGFHGAGPVEPGLSAIQNKLMTFRSRRGELEVICVCLVHVMVTLIPLKA